MTLPTAIRGRCPEPRTDGLEATFRKEGDGEEIAGMGVTILPV